MTRASTASADMTLEANFDGRRREPASVHDKCLDESAYDSGKVEYLADGSISIPVIDEELVVTKRRVVRERVIIRKHQEVERKRVDAELAKERVEVLREGDPGVERDERVR